MYNLAGRWRMLLYLISLLLAPNLSSSSSSPRPNILLMMADDLGWGDVAPNNPTIQYTPNIEKLASQGLRYTDYHSAASVCTPSRAGLLTGRLGQRTGVIKNFYVDSKGGLPLTERTMADYLKSAGYKTGVIGKWHLGHTEPYHPLSRGFDYYFGLPYSNDMGCLDSSTSSSVYNIKVDPVCGKNKLWNISLPLYEDRKIIEQPVKLVSLTERYAQRAEKFMSAALQEGKPFFMYLPMTHVHVPLSSAVQYTGNHFVDTVMEMDHYVGKMLSFLKDKDIEEDTIVIFTSDNGPWEIKCDLAGTSSPYLGKWQKAQGGGGSSSKMTTWEGGHRVPFIVSWPKIIPGGQVSTDLVSAYDILPTFALVANFSLPADREFDGIPLPFLVPHNETRALFHPDPELTELWSVRYGKYKAYYATNPDQDCQDGWGRGFLYHNPALVFDLEQDVGESAPLREKEVPEGLYHKIESLKKRIRDSIDSGYRSTVNWESAASVAPCCNEHNDYCACSSLDAWRYVRVGLYML